MEIYWFTLVVCVVKAITLRRYCDLVSDEPLRRCYVKETLTRMPHSPNQLSVDRNTNTLYFSFDFGQGEYVPAIFDIESKNLNVLKGVKDAFAIANDNTTGDTYFGGSYGIYKYSSKNKTLHRLNVSNLDIWWLFVKKSIFFIKFPNLNVYYYDQKRIKQLHELQDSIVHQFVFDDENNLFYINGTGLFGVKEGYNTPILIRDQPKFIAMMTDIKGHVYLCSEDGIYIVTKIIQKVKKLINLQGVLGFTFDKSNNIIYSNSQEIIRLLPVDEKNTQQSSTEIND